MKDFGLVVIGAHSGVWLSDLINKYIDQNILYILHEGAVGAVEEHADEHHASNDVAEGDG